MKVEIFISTSLNKSYEKYLKASYYCSDTICEGRINDAYEKIFDSNNNETYYKFKNFNETTKHSLKYEDHKYIRKQNIRNDIELFSKENLIRKCKDYKYCREFVKEIVIKNKLFSNKPSLLGKLYAIIWRNKIKL